MTSLLLSLEIASQTEQNPNTNLPKYSTAHKMAQAYAMLLTFLCLLCHKNISFAANFNTSTDESSLLALKVRITSDPNNILTANWSQGTSFCSWIGVTCSARHARVAALDFFNMSLRGTIAPEIGNLSFLTFLDLSNNSFTGLIPDEIGHLGRLRSLNMRFNQLSGHVPPSLGLLKNLEKLTLAANDLTGSIPWSIFNISSLREVSFSLNKLSGSLPPNICSTSSKLERLILSWNQLVGEIPRGLSYCTELNAVSLSFNNFTGSVPVDIGKLSRLQLLALGRNRLTGTIPPSVGNLTLLDMLDFSDNDIGGAVPSEMGQLSRLTILSLGINKLKGELPQSIFNLSRLQVLSLTMNELSGTFPRSIDQGLPNLRLLYLAMNQFSGEIPSSILNLSRLTGFDIGANSFSGLIPINLANFQNLEILRLRDNLFINDLSIPEQEFLTSLTNCKNLSVIEIQGNPITGVLPKSIGNMSETLEYLLVACTRIGGSIPSEIGNLHNLVRLHLINNELIGEIPEMLGRVEKLQRLSISGNRLHGTIPDSICNLENMFYLGLEDNRLSGQLPKCLGNLPALRELYLSNNSFNSSIPSALWSNRNLQVVSLSRNLFQGSFSHEIGNLRSLVSLYLFENQFSGSIPSTIGELQSLTHLEIQNNEFSGAIPPSFGNLRSLQYLDLSQNNLSGSIPNSLETLQNLAYFNVSFNQLTGEIPDGGQFQNFSADLFMGNNGLCGETRFRVKVCKRNTTKSSRKHKLLVYVLPSLASIIVGIAIVIFLLRRLAKNSASLPSSDSPFGLAHERISYYEILRATSNLDVESLIGKGSIGSVYKATFSNELTTAIKIFNLDIQGAFKSFDIECQIMRSLRHRNLVKVVTSCSNLDFKALVMEYMSNGNFDKWLYNASYRLSIDQRLGIMIDVASAIEYLHHGYSSPIVHCDLKPSNILLDEDMVAHVADFGISKLLTENQRMEQTKTLGTIGYMAPEYGSAGLVSTKVDIYSFGILLMETFTKKKPTNEMFVGELTMKGWVSESFPSTVMQIVDVELMNAEGDHVKDITKECLVSVMGIAVECAAELPEERPDMNDVLVRLKKINTKLHSSVIEVR